MPFLPQKWLFFRAMNWQARFLLIGVMVVTFIVLSVLVRPLMPKYRRWMIAQRHWTEPVFSVGMVIWGAGIWYLMISEDNYSNIPAMVMASSLIGAGVYFLVRQIFKKGK
jgi:hypothetical protein